MAVTQSGSAQGGAIIEGREPPAGAAPPTALAGPKLAALVAFGALLWCLAALFIRWAGPRGLFAGAQGALIYALTVPGTVLLNRRALKLARLPPRAMVDAIAVGIATAACLDGLFLNFLPAFYGGDRVGMLGGASWLLWAVGVAALLSLVQASRAERAP